jgi:RHS repeat-associated protein
MAYDGTGRRISKTRWVKSANSQDWEKELVTHYTGIGTEIRESFTGPAAETKVVVNMPNGLGRYGIEDAAAANANASKNFEWYLKNHLGSTMLVYGTVASTNPNEADIGEKIAAYDYRSFGEMVELTPPATGKVTENFTGKEHDDETMLSNHGARLLDPMIGMWISVDPLRFFTSPYLYMGNGYNPIRFADLTGMKPGDPFGSRKEAAEDFARTYNDDSIREGVEYSTAIYSYMKDGEKLYLYNIPLKGTPDRTPFDTYLPSGCKMESSAHTHGEFLDSYKLGNFVPSSGDKEGDYFATYIIGKISGPAYLSNPAGHLIEYGLDAIGNTYYKILPTTGIAADDKSPIIMPGAPSAFDGSDDDVYR